MPNVPLILTLTLDDVSQQFFNQLRRKHFPPERNFLDAHLTLFHHLPAHEPQVMLDIEQVVNTSKVMTLLVAEVKSIGNGVAYKIECAQLQSLHKQLQQQWAQWLIPQDAQKLWPHITVQNKVEPAKAWLLKQELEYEFQPFEIKGLGLSLFEYHGGPWKFVNKFKFTY